MWLSLLLRVCVCHTGFAVVTVFRNRCVSLLLGFHVYHVYWWPASLIVFMSICGCHSYLGVVSSVIFIEGSGGRHYTFLLRFIKTMAGEFSRKKLGTMSKMFATLGIGNYYLCSFIIN